MPDKIWNLSVWDKSYDWSKDGEEWDDFARFCAVPYEKWKDSLSRTFLIGHLRQSSEVLEIGPGHGRWSALLPNRIPAGTLHLVDLSPNCIEFCRQRFQAHKNIRYYVNDGKSLTDIGDKSIDFCWSFDTFVHVEESEVRPYAKELRRVMKPQSMGAIHHPGNPTEQQRQNGCRSKLDSRKFAAILAENGLHVIRQVSEWGQGCNLHLTGDVITVFARP